VKIIMFGKRRDQELNRVIAEMRDERVSRQDLERSAQRVWERLGVASETGAAVQVAEGCAEIRIDLPRLRRGELSAARRLIIEDHMRECASCRAYAAGLPDPVATAAAWRIEPSVCQRAWRPARYGWAAVAVVVLAATTWIARDRYVAGPAGSRAEIDSISGQAYLVSATTERPLNARDQIAQGQTIRTAGNSHAILTLLDGSRVEMNQRTELSVSASFRNTTLRLDQGDIIVQAPKRRSGHLSVVTTDCTVSDTGTIFSIESGTKGSRVAVIEGSVDVAQGGKESTVYSGESIATAQTVSPEPVSDQISWSQDRQRYSNLLDEFSRLGHRLEQIRSPEPRYGSQIFPVVPSDTVVYVSVPNFGDMLTQAESIFHDELNRSAVLRDWWTHVATPQQQDAMQQAMQKIEAGSQYLGKEFVLVGGLGHEDGLVLLARIEKPGLAEFLHQQVTTAALAGESRASMHVVNEKSLDSVPRGTEGIVALVRPNALVIGTSLPGVRHIDAALNTGSSGFANSDFGKEVLGVYNRGAQMLFAADLQRILDRARQSQQTSGGSAPAERNTFLQNIGFGDVRYLIATHGDATGETENRAVLEFGAQRSGLDSWLASPSPMGSLNFVSANASAAVAVVTKQPAEMFDDIVHLVAPQHSAETAEQFRQAEAQIGLDFRNNLAGVLGGEVTFALDGPMFPKPSWKLIIEVNDPATLQQSIATLVGLAGQHVAVSGKPVVTLDQEQVGERTFYKLHSQQPGFLSGIDYTFAEGYLVAAPSRALVRDALETRANGNSLAASGSFRSLLPRDAHANFSGLVYQNLGPLVRPLVSQFGSTDAALFQHLASDAKPSAICAYGGTDTIEIASTSSLFDLQPNAFTLIRLLGNERSGTPGRFHP
jgi:ferric-dicitrate binding protein FerR (iron transport regulator)